MLLNEFVDRVKDEVFEDRAYVFVRTEGGFDVLQIHVVAQTGIS